LLYIHLIDMLLTFDLHILLCSALWYIFYVLDWTFIYYKNVNCVCTVFDASWYIWFWWVRSWLQWTIFKIKKVLDMLWLRTWCCCMQIALIN